MILVLELLVLSPIVFGAPQVNRRLQAKSQTCGRFSFECDNESCIDSWLTCDGSRDCVDGSDETYKACFNFKSCPSSGYRCDYGGCVEANLVCDGTFDCIDGSDESNCFEVTKSTEMTFTSTLPPSNCPMESWICKSGKCIDEFLLCDGEANCDDASDETSELCIHIRCPESSFRCNYGACVEKSSKCDGIAHCLDRSDENNEDCSEDSMFAMTISIVRTTRVTSSTHKINGFEASTTNPTTHSIFPNRLITRFNSDSSPSTTYSNLPSTLLTTLMTTSASMEHPTEETTEESRKSSTANTDMTHRPDIIELQMKRNKSSVNDCRIPEQVEGSYHKVLDCQTNWIEGCLGQPGTRVPAKTVLESTCSTYHVRSDGVSTSAFSVCIKGEWKPPPEPCFRMCRGIVSVSLDLQCTYNGAEIDCRNSVPHGTTAQRSCKPNYMPINQGPPTAHCTSGHWTEPLYHCRPVCGIKPDLQYNVQALISNGRSTTATEHPWHASLYSVDNVGKATREYICGGSIISQFAILTAAHCIYDEHKKIIVTSISVAVGKTTRHWDNIDHGQENLNVKRIYYQRDYRGRESNYQFDIAILEVDMLKFSSSVMPVCLDLNNDLPPTGTVGIIVGFGLTMAASENSISDVLRVAELPIIDKESCRSLAPVDFRKYIGFDKFCAGHVQGTGIQRGDSGGGYIFLSDNVLFNVYGIVSVRQYAKSDEDVGEFTVFTNVADHAAFVTGILSCIERRLEDKIDRCDVPTASVQVIDPV